MREIKKETREYIEGIAKEFCRKYQIGRAGAGLEEAVYTMKGSILYLDHTFDKGKIIKLNESEDQFQIQLTQNPQTRRGKIALAYWLGHLFLHTSFLRQDDQWNNQSENMDFSESCHRLEATLFAMSVFMPKDKVKFYIEQIGKRRVDLNKLASAFGVSVYLAGKRCRDLGWL